MRFRFTTILSGKLCLAGDYMHIILKQILLNDCAKLSFSMFV